MSERSYIVSQTRQACGEPLQQLLYELFSVKGAFGSRSNQLRATRQPAFELRKKADAGKTEAFSRTSSSCLQPATIEESDKPTGFPCLLNSLRWTQS